MVIFSIFLLHYAKQKVLGVIIDFRLQVFVVVARELSFTRAAEELAVSQPAVTKHIKELERLLSVPLFRRSGNRISLSDEGARLLPFAKGVLEGYEKLDGALEVAEGEMSGRLRIGASTTIAQYILPEILARFRGAYPGVEVTLMSGNSEEVLAEVESDRVDVALVEDAHSSPMFHYESFFDDRVVLVSSHPSHAKIGVEEVVKLPLVLRENGSGTLEVVERELMQHHITRRMLRVEMQIGSSEGIVRYLKASSCYAFISEMAVAEYLCREELYVFDIEGVEIGRTLRFAQLHGLSNRRVELFKNFCLNHRS